MPFKPTTTHSTNCSRLFSRAVIIVSFSILAIFTCCHLAMKVSFWNPTRTATSSVSFKDFRHQHEHASNGGRIVTKAHGQDDGDSTDRRPLAIIHIGPRKCATTNIQYVLGHETTRNLLEQDNFVYLGKGAGLKTGVHALQKKMGIYIRDCLWKPRKCTNETTNLWMEFVQSIQTLRKNGQNIIVSDEAIPHVVIRSQDMQQMMDAFDGYNIRIIMAYRRYYEWIISEYNQQYKESYTHIIQPFVTWYRQQQQQVPSKLRSEVYAPPNKELMERYRPYVDEVRVFNMHDGLGNQDLIERFVCQMIPEATITCRVAKQGGLPVAPLDRQKVSVTTIDSQYVAEQIYLTKKYLTKQKGAMKKTTSANAMTKMMSREEIISFKKDVMASGISNRIQEEINRHDEQLSQQEEQHFYHLPRLCLTEQEQDDLLQQTIQIENVVVPEFFYYSTSTGSTTAASQEESIRVDFEKSVVNSNKYCTIDTQTLLQEEYPTTQNNNTWYEKYSTSLLI